MNEAQEQFLKILESLKASAKTKKNTLDYDEILKAFEGIELTEDKMDLIFEYLEKNRIDVMQVKSEEDEAAYGIADVRERLHFHERNLQDYRNAGMPIEATRKQRIVRDALQLLLEKLEAEREAAADED